MDAGSREENATKQEFRAVHGFHETMNGSAIEAVELPRNRQLDRFEVGASAQQRPLPSQPSPHIGNGLALLAPPKGSANAADDENAVEQREDQDRRRQHHHGTSH